MSLAQHARMTRSRLLLCLPVMWLLACGSGAPPAPITQPPPIEQPSPPDTVDPPPVDPPPVDPPPVDPPVDPPPVDPSPPVTPEVQRPFVMPTLQASVPEYELLIPEEAMKKFEADVWRPEQDAVFKAGGKSYAVKVRLRGASARYFVKKSWNVSFDKDVRFEGRTSLNLVAEFADATLLAEKMAFDLMAAMRVPASKATFVRLKLNGHNEGVFLDIEQVNKAFLKAHAFADDDATIYRCGWKDCALEKHLQLEHYLRSMVLDALMSNNFVEDSESYFIYDRAVAKWSYVPWDLNNVDARWWYLNPAEAMSTSSNNMRHPLFNFTLTDAWTERMYLQRKTETLSYPGYLPVFSNLGTRVLANPELRERLGARLDKALDELFTPEVMNPYIDAMHALINPYMNGAPYIDYAQFKAGRDYMKRYVKERRAFVEKDWARMQAQRPTLVFEAFDPVAGWVDVGNRGTAPLSLQGMVLTTNLRVSLAQSDHAPTQVKAPMGAVLPNVTVPPGGKVRLKTSELGIQLAPRGELGLFDGKSVVGVKDFLFYGALRSGQQYERGDKGWEVR